MELDVYAYTNMFFLTHVVLLILLTFMFMSRPKYQMTTTRHIDKAESSVVPAICEKEVAFG